MTCILKTKKGKGFIDLKIIFSMPKLLSQLELIGDLVNGLDS